MHTIDKILFRVAIKLVCFENGKALVTIFLFSTRLLFVNTKCFQVLLGLKYLLIIFYWEIISSFHMTKIKN